MYMISDNIFFFNVLLYIFKTVQFEKILIDELGIQSGLLNQNFQKVFGDSNEHNIFCNSYMCVKKKLLLFSLPKLIHIYCISYNFQILREIRTNISSVNLGEVHV